VLLTQEIEMSAFLQHDSDGQLSIGQPAPEFDLPDTISGKNVSLDQLQGSVEALCVIFSCNHCPWVIKYEDRMIELGKSYSAKGVGFVVISSNDVVKFPQDGPVPMMKRAALKGYPFPYLYDESQAVAHAYGALVTPHVFLFDSELKLRYRGGVDDNPDRESRPTKEYLRDALEALLMGENNRITPDVTRAVGCSVKWK